MTIQPTQPQPQPQMTSVQSRPKRKRPLDKSLPLMDICIPESKLFMDLLNTEKKLDALLMRKRLDIQEAMTRPQRMKKTLRLFISNSASDQPWQTQQEQTSSSSASMMDDQDQQSQPPNWTLRIEGRLIDHSRGNKHAPPQKKCSTFFRSLMVELQRDQELFPEGNLIEWYKSSAQQESDGFEIKRIGDQNIPCKLLIQLDYMPDKFKLSPALATLLNLQYETRQGVVMGLWQYIKQHRLQDPSDRRLIKTDDALRAVFPMQQIPFPQLNDLLTPHLLPMDPIVIDYVIQVDQERTDTVVYDIEVELNDPLHMRMASWTQHHGNQRDMAQLESQVVGNVQRIHLHRMKREFMLAFAQDPAGFIQRWVDSQSRDLEVVLADHQVNLEAQRRASFYAQPWVGEAIFHYLSQRR